MFQTIKGYLAAAGAFLFALAGYVVLSRNHRAAEAQVKVGQGREEDAASAQRRRTAGEILARIDAEKAAIPAQSPERTPGEIDAELQRRGHIK